MSTPTLTFVDHVGGELAVIAASLAAARSISAHAHTTVTPRAISPEAIQVLREIGAPSPGVASAFATNTVEGALVELGGHAIANARASLGVKPYDGPGTTAFGDATLERLALLRIARDRIDAYLDLS